MTHHSIHDPNHSPKDLIPRRELAPPSPTPAQAGQVQALEVLAGIPEEQVWLLKQRSKHTRETYQDAVIDFIETLRLKDPGDFKKVSPAAVIAWRDNLEKRGKSIRTIKARMSALSSLFKHLVEKGEADANPVREVKAPELRVRRGKTKALSVNQARKLLDAPPPDTLQGLRDRAILAIGLQVGPRRAEIAKLKVRDFHESQEYPALYLRRKRGSEGSVVVHQNVAQRIRAYLEKTGHRVEKDAPLFLPVRKNQVTDKQERHLTPKQVDRIFKRWCKKAGLPTDFSSHTMRATFITTAFNNGASMEDVQHAVGHAHSSTTQLYDRREDNPERAASLFATY